MSTSPSLSASFGSVSRAVAAAVTLVGGLVLAGWILGLFDTAFGGVLVVVTSAVVVTALIWWNARILERMDVARRQADAALKQANEELALSVAGRTTAVRNANEQLERELQERKRAEGRLEVLLEIARVVGARMDLPEALRLICRQLARLTGAETVATYVREVQSDELRPVAGYHVPEAALATLATTPVPLSAPGFRESLFGDGRVVWSDDVQNDPRFGFSLFRRVPHQSGVVVPLLLDGEVAGAVYLVWWRERRRWADAELVTLHVVGQQAGIVVRNARLYAALESRAARRRTLARVNQLVSSLAMDEVLREISRAAATLMDAPVASFWIVDEAGQTLEARAFSDEAASADFPAWKLRFDQGGVGWVATHRQALNVPSVFEDPRFVARDWCVAHRLSSFLAVPVLLDGTLLAVLALNGRKPFHIGPDDRILLDSLVAQAAVAIRNASLYTALQHANRELTASLAALQQRTREMALLTEMGDLLQACASAEEAYTVVNRFVGRFFPDEVGAVCMLGDAGDLVQTKVAWGTSRAWESTVFAPDDCWALRRGRPHVVADGVSGLLCAHLVDSLPLAYMCTPLTAHGEMLGVLYLSSASGEPASGLSEAKQQLATIVAERLSLALVNLRLRETLRSQSIRDPLTGLFNRRYLDETLEREISRAGRNGHPIGIIMLDIDHFKWLNDTFGHDAGDAVLKELGQVLRAGSRKADIACRYGGEEFIVILPEASLESTRRRAEQLRQRAKHLQVVHRGQALEPVTLSLGVAAFPDQGSTANALIQEADAALYRAKAEGRDRVMGGRTTEA